MSGFAPVIHLSPETTIRRKRILPIPGRVIARQGQKVRSNDVIAEASLNPEHTFINVARGLGVRDEEAGHLIQRKVGETITEGDVIAGPIGVARRVVRAPTSGRVVMIEDGHMLIEVDTQPFELQAGLAGVVDELIPERGAVIQTTGSLIQGVWGNGKMDFGLLVSRINDPGEEITVDHIDLSLRGSIIFGGYCTNIDIIQIGAEIPLRGLVLGSMEAFLVSEAKKVNYPIVVIEGFGYLPMNKIAYNLLLSSQNQEVSVNAEPYNRYKGTRPEVVIPKMLSQQPILPKESEAFAPGQRVRIIRSPYATTIATIEKLHTKPIELSSGLKAPAAELLLEDGDRVLVSLSNTEVIA